MKKRPPTVGAYADCAAVLDAVLAKGPAKLPFDNRGAAINFRQRCYKLRNILQAASLAEGEIIPKSKYDRIYIQLHPLKKGPEPLFLEFLLRDGKKIGELTFTEPDFEPPEPPADDELSRAAQELAQKLGLTDGL